MRTATNSATPRAELRRNRLLKVGWLSVMFSFAPQTAAFHTTPREPFAMLHRRDVRETSTELYAGGNHPRKAASTSTRLHYRDGSDDSTGTKNSIGRSKWWNGLFSSQSDSDSVNTQDSVDEYLEFLERRYNRLHEEKEKKPFSAMNWLLQDSSREGEIMASTQQKEDALYVLGVAGLASQKLLQKHPQLQEAKHESDFGRPTSIEALDTIITSAEDVTFGHLVIQQVLVPIAKLLYFVHFQKRMLLDVQLKRVKGYATKAAKNAIRGLLYAPGKITKSIIKIGGGKGSVASTIAIASAILVLLRPLLQGLLSEGTVPP